MKINFFINRDKTVGGENVLKFFATVTTLDKNIYKYQNFKDIIKTLYKKDFENEFVFTTLQKYNILNMFFSVFKNYTPIIRETFLYSYRKNSIKNIFFNTIYKFLLYVSNPLVIVQSRYMEKDFIQKFKYKNILLVNNPIDPKIIDTYSEIENYDFKYIIYVGRLVEDKGVHILIDSYLKSDLPQNNIKLLIVGDGSYKNNLLKVAQNSEMILFFGNIKQPFNLIKNSEFLVLPSLHEGFPNVLLESIGLDTLFLSNNIPSVKEMCFDDNSFLYNDKLELINKLNTFIALNTYNKDNLLNKLKQYKEFYNYQNIIKDFDKEIGDYTECL